MKRFVLWLLGRLGYELHKTRKDPDVGLYSSLFSQESIQKRRFYNIGAGGFVHPCWTNIDYDSDWYSFNRRLPPALQHDLLSLRPLPVEANTAEVVYSSHVVEHISDEAAQNMFNEAYRILKPKGCFRVTTPNIDLEYRAYRDNDRRYFYWIDTYSKPEQWKRIKLNKPMNKASIGQVFLEHFASSVSILHADGAKERIDDEELNRIFETMEYEEALRFICAQCPLEIQRKYPGNHINWWNRDKLFAMLRKAGFANVYLSAYGQSCYPILRDTRFFDSTHPKISIYVEATKEKYCENSS